MRIVLAVLSSFWMVLFCIASGKAEQVIIYSGILHKDDRFDRRLTCINEGEHKTQSRPGEYSVLIIDEKGETLEILEIEISFRMSVYPLGMEQTASFPFLVWLPYHTSAKFFQLKHNEQVLDEVDIEDLDKCPDPLYGR